MFDITERKEAEDSLRVSEERLRVIFDTSHSGIIMIDPDGQISFASKRMTELLCCSLSELLGSPYLNHLHPEELQGNDNLIEQLMNRESDNGATERHYLRCDGSDFWGYVTSTRLKTEGGAPQALIAVVTDITEWKTQQLALQEETARWKMMMERSRDGIVILDAASNAVREVNPAFADMLGYSRDEMLGKHPWDWDLRFNREEIEAKADEILGGDIFFETKMRCKDGTTRNVEVSSTLTELSGERHFFCICRDITERKRAEDEIRRDKALLRCLVDSVGDLIFIKDMDGVYQACNKAAEKFIGMPESEQIGKTDFDFFDRDVAEVIHENDRQILESGKESRSEEWVTYQDGRRGLLDILKAPFYGSDSKKLGLVGISRDITQRKHAEELIRQERELCLDLVNTQPAGIYRVRVSPREQWSKNAWNSSELTPYTVELVNDRFCEILGINRQDMETKPGIIIDLIHPEDKTEFARKNEEANAKLIPFQWEGRLIIEGNILWAHFESLPRPLENGEVLWSGILYDITERKRMEEELWKSESILRKIFDSIPELLSVIDRDLRIVRSNWHGGYEYVPEDIRNKSPYCHEAYYPGQDKPCENCHTIEVFRTGKPAAMEKFHPWIGFIEAHAYPVFDDAGNVIMAIEHVRDITERKKMEKAVQESEELFRTLCNSAPIGIFRADCDGNIIYINPHWEKISGLSATESLGKGWIRAVHPDDREIKGKIWLEAVAARKPCSQEYRLMNPKRKTVLIRTQASPIMDQAGSCIGYVGIVEDITERRQAMQDMTRTQKLESLGVLAGGIAHDFNNILTAILGNISLARIQLQSPDKVMHRLAEAENAAARARDLTQQLLTFARGGEPVKQVINVESLLKETAIFACHGSAARCEFVLGDDLWPVIADEGQLLQVINNLVINAIQAMPDGGTVTIGAANDSSRLDGKRSVKIFVTDSGTGIPEHHFQRIFDPYFTTKQNGSGLGLATCFSIVKKHDGIITFESNPGKGTTFHVYLPASGQNRAVTHDTEMEIVHGSGRILVMDDEEEVREIAQAMLEELGYSVECAKNGSDTVDLYRKRKEKGTPFSAVIMDLTIPGGMGGKEAINFLLKIDPNVKAIVSSGYSTDPVMANYREYGFVAVLRKPYRPQEMSTILHDCLSSDDLQPFLFD
jgi:PAS domain S-box-containing protein